MLEPATIRDPLRDDEAPADDRSMRVLEWGLALVALVAAFALTLIR